MYAVDGDTIDSCTARNSDLNGIVTSMKQMEDRFNKKFNYPYIFLNEAEFSSEFKECVGYRATSSTANQSSAAQTCHRLD